MKKTNLSSASGSKAPRLIKIGLVFCPCITYNMDGSITFHLFRPVYSIVANGLVTVEFVSMDGVTQVTINEHVETKNFYIHTLIGTATGNVSYINTKTEQQ